MNKKQSKKITDPQTAKPETSLTTADEIKANDENYHLILDSAPESQKVWVAHYFVLWCMLNLSEQQFSAGLVYALRKAREDEKSKSKKTAKNTARE